LLNDRILKLNTKLIHCNLPVLNRHIPFQADIPQCQLEQFPHRFITWKRSKGFYLQKFPYC